MSEQPHDFISKRIEKTEKQILSHINKLNKKLLMVGMLNLSGLNLSEKQELLLRNINT